MCHSVLTYFIPEAFGDSSIVSQFHCQYVKDLLVGWLCLGETAVEKQVCQCNSSGQWFGHGWINVTGRDEKGRGTNLPYPRLKSSAHREAICWLHGCLWKCFCVWLRKSRCPVQSKYCIGGRRATPIKLSRSLSPVYVNRNRSFRNIKSCHDLPARPPGSHDHTVHNSCKNVDLETDIIFKHLSVSLSESKSESNFKLEFNNSSNLSPQSEAL